MAVGLALLTALLWGSSDFFGALGTKREPVTRVMLWAHGIGLVAIAAIAPILASEFLARDALLGVAAGFIGLAGLLLLYTGLSRGPMAVVAPLSALSAALVPVVAGFGSGESFSGVTTLGLATGLAAVVAISWEGNLDAAGPPVTARVVGEAVLAGCCFGSIVLLYDMTSESTAPWPVVTGRIATVVALLLVALVLRRPLGPGRSLGLAALAGFGDTFANLTLLLAAGAATTSVELSVVAVVAAFFPAATVIWARFLLHEALGRIRLAGLAAGLCSITLMTLG